MINAAYLLRGRREAYCEHSMSDDGAGEAATYNLRALAAQHFQDLAAHVVISMTRALEMELIVASISGDEVEG